MSKFASLSRLFFSQRELFQKYVAPDVSRRKSNEGEDMARTDVHGYRIK